MMTAVEYRAKSLAAQERADGEPDPQWKAAFSSHALEWAALALSADIQAKLEIDAARAVD